MSSPNIHKHELAGKRIIVTGAGLAGLAFASALERYWPQEHPKPQLVIYERSARALNQQHQGYTMNLKPEAGLHAMKELGLIDATLQASTVGINGTQPLPTFWTKEWKPFLDTNTPAKMQKFENDPGNSTIRIVRYVLRDILLANVPSNTTIHWEKGCTSALDLSNGKVQVTLSDGSTDSADLLIAADGANSAVRSAILPSESLQYAGAICIMGTSRFPSGKPDILSKKWGMTFSGTGTQFLNFPVDENTGVWGLTYRSDQPRERIKGDEALARNDEIMQEVRQRGAIYHEPFSQFIDATDPMTLQVFSAMHKSPISHAEKVPRASVVFIGDANHPMSPFSGNGANMALLDAVVLAKELAGCRSMRTAVEIFDEDSVPRCQKSIDRSRIVISVLHARGIAFFALRMVLGVLNFCLTFRSSE